MCHFSELSSLEVSKGAAAKLCKFGSVLFSLIPMILCYLPSRDFSSENMICFLHSTFFFFGGGKPDSILKGQDDNNN